MNDESIIDEFLETLLSEKYVSFNTCASYRYDLIDLLAFLRIQGLRIVNTLESDLRLYLKSLFERNYKTRSIVRKISAIRSLFRFLYSEARISSDPSLNLVCPKLPTSLPTVLTLCEINMLLNAFSDRCDEKDLRLKAIISILYSSGMRISELINIELKVVHKMLKSRDTDFGHIFVCGKSEKDRAVFLNKLAIDSLLKYLKVRKSFVNHRNLDSRWLFPGKKYDYPITRQRIVQLFKNLALRVNIDVKKISPHKIRHSFATHMLNSGADVISIQKMLGHCSLATTQIYTYVANDKLKNELLKCHPLAKLEPLSKKLSK